MGALVDETILRVHQACLTNGTQAAGWAEGQAPRKRGPIAMAYEKCAFKPASSSAKNVIIGDSSAAPSQPQATVALTQPCPHQVVNTSSTRQGRRDPRHKRWLQRKALTAYRYSYRYSSAASASAFEHFSSLLIQPLRMTLELFCRINRYERLSPLRLLIKELDSPFQANSGESGSVVRHSHDGVMTVIAILARLSGELGRVRVAAVNFAVLAGNPCPCLGDRGHTDHSPALSCSPSQSRRSWRVLANMGRSDKHLEQEGQDGPQIPPRECQQGHPC